MIWIGIFVVLALIASAILACTFWVGSVRDRQVEQLPVTPLGRLDTFAGSGKLVRIEAVAVGEPLFNATSGDSLAYQRLHIYRRVSRNWSDTTDEYYPPYFRVSDGAGVLWIDSSSIDASPHINRFYVSIANSESSQEQVARHRPNLAPGLLKVFDDKMSGTDMLARRSATVWTIKKGDHVFAVGEIVKDKEHSRYVMQAPAFWRAPAFFGRSWVFSF